VYIAHFLFYGLNTNAVLLGGFLNLFERSKLALPRRFLLREPLDTALLGTEMQSMQGRSIIECLPFHFPFIEQPIVKIEWEEWPA